MSSLIFSSAEIWPLRAEQFRFVLVAERKGSLVLRPATPFVPQGVPADRTNPRFPIPNPFLSSEPQQPAFVLRVGPLEHLAHLRAITAAKVFAVRGSAGARAALGEVEVEGRRIDELRIGARSLACR